MYHLNNHSVYDITTMNKLDIIEFLLAICKYNPSLEFDNRNKLYMYAMSLWDSTIDTVLSSCNEN